METTELIGVSLFAVGLLALTAQTAFAFGRQLGQTRERQLADRRVNGIIGYENARRPKSAKSKRKRARASSRIMVGSVSLPSLEVRA